MLEGVVIGAGNRGARAYVSLLERRPELARIVGVAEPDAARRESFGARHAIAPERRFVDHRALLDAPRMADFALIATEDSLHVEPALAALERGYHVLLEKPMAVRASDCHRLVEAADRCGRLLQVCHVLRYAPFFAALKQIVDSGELGRIVTIQHAENVSYWHYAHSYCRGHWRNAEASSPLILAKSCHDLDVLLWLAGAPPRHLSSLSRPTELCAANAPPGAPEFCIEGCPEAPRCPYDAVATYLHAKPLGRDLSMTRRPRLLAAAVPALIALRESLGRIPIAAVQERLRWRGWPVSTITADPSRSGIERALRETRYGRCVYRVGDNDQVSSQTVDLLFDNGVNASFTLHGTSHREGRTIRVHGTRGSAVGAFHLLEQHLEVFDHQSGRRRTVALSRASAGHGGGDWGLFEGFLDAVRGDAESLTSARESLLSHLMAFAADRSAREGVVMRWSPSPTGGAFEPGASATSD